MCPHVPTETSHMHAHITWTEAPHMHTHAYTHRGATRVHTYVRTGAMHRHTHMHKSMRGSPIKKKKTVGNRLGPAAPRRP